MSTSETSRIVTTLLEAAAKAGFQPIGSVRCLDDIETVPGKLCLGMECLDRDLWDYFPAAPLIKAAGTRRVRLQSGWQKTEREPGVYDFAWLDAIVDRLLSDGIRPFLSLSYGNRIYVEEEAVYPNLGNGGLGHMPIKTDREREGWTNYVRAIVRHFSGRIDTYEIWNEPDVSAFYVGELHWSEAYMELVKLTAPVIREAAPEATVVTCTAGFLAIRPLLELGMGDYTDIHAFHNYSIYPEQYTRNYFRNQILRYRSMAPKLRFWRDEAGCPSYNDPISKGALSSCTVSELRQMKVLLRHLMLDIENDDIELTSYFHAYDFEHFSHKLRYHYGIIRHETLSRKPSYDVYQMLTHLFGGEIRSDASVGLAAFPKRGSANADEELMRIRFASVIADGKRIFAYELPLPVDDGLWVRSVKLSMPWLPEMRRPVILDPVTRAVYPIAAPDEFAAPLTDYPMFILDAEDFAPLLALSAAETASAVAEKMAQVEEE